MRRLIASLALVLVTPTVSRAQRAHANATRSITGSYVQPGCGLQVAPVSADTVRIQLECSRGAPTYNLGFLDDRLPIHAGTVVYTRTEDGGSCRIGITFAHDRAVVTEDGTDVTCGFGAGVTVRGTYRRTTRAVPPFDLSPCG